MDPLDRDGTLRAEMGGAIDRTHASLSEELFDLVLVVEYVHVPVHSRSKLDPLGLLRLVIEYCRGAMYKFTRSNSGLGFRRFKCSPARTCAPPHTAELIAERNF